MSDQPPSSAPGGPGAIFCGSCGAAMATDARFCGTCGAPPPGSAAEPGGAAAGGAAAGASTWQGVSSALDEPTAAMAATPGAAPPAGPPPGPAGPPVGPGGPGGPGGPSGPAAETKGKGPLVAIVLLVLAALGVGAFLVLGGDDDESAGDDTTTTTEDEETTTTEGDETTTTTEAEVTTTVTVEEDPLAGINFVSLTDSTGRLVVEVPDDWTDVSLVPLTADNNPTIVASTDIAALQEGFEVPGVSFVLLPSPPGDFDGSIDFLANLASLPSACTATGKQDYSDGVFTGRFEVFEDCAGVGTSFVQIVAARADGLTVQVGVQLLDTDPIEVALQIANTFNING